MPKNQPEKPKKNMTKPKDKEIEIADEPYEPEPIISPIIGTYNPEPKTNKIPIDPESKTNKISTDPKPDINEKSDYPVEIPENPEPNNLEPINKKLRMETNIHQILACKTHKKFEELQLTDDCFKEIEYDIWVTIISRWSIINKNTDNLIRLARYFLKKEKPLRILTEEIEIQILLNNKIIGNEEFDYSSPIPRAIYNKRSKRTLSFEIERSKNQFLAPNSLLLRNSYWSEKDIQSVIQEHKAEALKIFSSLNRKAHHIFRSLEDPEVDSLLQQIPIRYHI